MNNVREWVFDTSRQTKLRKAKQARPHVHVYVGVCRCNVRMRRGKWQTTSRRVDRINFFFEGCVDRIMAKLIWWWAG